MFAAFAALGAAAEPVVYSDDRGVDVRQQLLGLDGVLVSAHPDVILKLATKRVIGDTAHMSWGVETHLYASHAQFATELHSRLVARGPLVLKQHRGMGGAGVWKVELDGDAPSDRDLLRVQHAAKGSAPETAQLEEFLERCRPYFAGDGLMVEQPYQPRLAEGMIRVYLSHDRVVGFAHQYPTRLLPLEVAARLPTANAFLSADEPEFQPLRSLKAVRLAAFPGVPRWQVRTLAVDVNVDSGFSHRKRVTQL